MTVWALVGSFAPSVGGGQGTQSHRLARLPLGYRFHHRGFFNFCLRHWLSVENRSCGFILGDGFDVREAFDDGEIDDVRKSTDGEFIGVDVVVVEI